MLLLGIPSKLCLGELLWLGELEEEAEVLTRAGRVDGHGKFNEAITGI